MRALEFIRDHVTFKLPYDFSYHMKTPHFRIRQNLDSISIRSQKHYQKSEPPNSGAHNLDQYTYTCWEYKSIFAWLHHSNLDRFKSEFLNFQLIIYNLLDTFVDLKHWITYYLVMWNIGQLSLKQKLLWSVILVRPAQCPRTDLGKRF